MIVTDSGFAPNPYWGYCTLATCKPLIRRTAKPGDWVIGVGSKAGVGSGKLVYAMHVSEVIAFEQYNSDSRFTPKKPHARQTPERLVVTTSTIKAREAIGGSDAPSTRPDT